MRFNYSFEIALQKDTVYRMLRDDLANLARYLPNVQHVEVLERKQAGTHTSIVNQWKGKYMERTVIGRIAHLKELSWLNREEWFDETSECRWSYEFFVFKDYLSIEGKQLFSSDGKHTTVTIMGDLTVDLIKFPLIPPELKKTINEAVSRDVLEIMKTNFITLKKGLEEYARKKAWK